MPLSINPLNIQNQISSQLPSLSTYKADGANSIALNNKLDSYLNRQNILQSSNFVSTDLFDQKKSAKKNLFDFLSQFHAMWMAFAFGTAGDVASAIVENNIYKKSEKITHEQRFDFHCKKAAGSAADLIYWLPVLGVQKICTWFAGLLVKGYEDKAVADKVADNIGTFISLFIGFWLNEFAKTFMETKFTKWMLENISVIPKPYFKFFSFDKEALLKARGQSVFKPKAKAVHA